jgi:hypothetical protein
VGLDLGAGAAARSRSGRRVFAAVAIEQGDQVARRQAQHLDMVGDRLGQGDNLADGQLGAKKRGIAWYPVR